MADFLEVIETIRAEEASIQRLFSGEGKSVRGATSRSARYQQQLAEAAKLIAGVYTGKRPMYQLQEAMTTSDFPYLFGDVLDRQLLAAYQETPQSYRNFTKVGRVRDFRSVKRFSVYGGDQVLPEVKQQQQYPIAKLNENTPIEYAVSKRGRRIPLAWETMMNDDMEALADIPARYGRAARRSEQKFVTGLYVDASGPHASVYTTGNLNKVTSNPALSVAALQTAMTQLAGKTDENGEPIFIDTVELVVPPALEVVALNYLNALQLELTEKGGTSNTKLVAANWMKTKFRLNVDYYIPIVASTANGNTSWFLFANPNSGRAAMQIDFLAGHEEPEIFIKSPNSSRVGGGEDAMSGDFDTDTIEYKVRHVFGGASIDPKMTMGSNGSGS